MKMGNLLLIFMLFVTSCKKENIEAHSTNILDKPILPEHFPPPNYKFSNNPYSKEGFELGRKLFFDPILSVNGTIACASCHHQKDAFSDGGKTFSIGINNQLSDRNSPPVFNMAWNTSFMWDGGINHIEIMPFSPIINPKEMGEDLSNVVQKLQSHPAYPALFKKVFDKPTVTDQQLFWALAQYMGNLVSANSRYDYFIRGEDALSQQELAGLQLFRQHCAACHQEPLFTDYLFHNNGLDTTFTDEGRYRITLDPTDMGKFKTPTLRNIAFTAPYMHDGRLQSIEAVINHYSSGIEHSATLSAKLPANGISLTDKEKSDLIHFLHALSDFQFLQNTEFSQQ
jgi:cytochrome c peroxidase